jgi:hypothetical protein
MEDILTHQAFLCEGMISNSQYAKTGSTYGEKAVDEMLP